MKRNRILTSCAALALVASVQFTKAGTHVWSGTQGGLWSNPANWSSGGAPSAFEAAPVVIQFPATPSAEREMTNDLVNLRVDVLAFFGGNYLMYSESEIALTGSQPPFPYAANLIS